jgi:hypothetical protein
MILAHEKCNKVKKVEKSAHIFPSIMKGYSCILIN